MSLTVYDTQGRPKKAPVPGPAGGQAFTAILGDGIATSFTVVHNFGTRSVAVAVYRTATPYDEVECDIERTDANTVTVRTFPTVPAVGELTAVVAAPGTAATFAITMDSWHVVGNPGEPAFQNGWAALDARVPKFRKTPDGRVIFAGIIKGGTGGAAAFTLPVGYRPPYEADLSTTTSTGWGNIAVLADGSVVPNQGGTGYVFLDNVEFDTQSVLQTASVAAQALDAWHNVGAPGEPTFGSTWANYDPSVVTWPGVGFRKDPTGRVHLKGLLGVSSGTAAGAVFTLPAGYRPRLGVILDTSVNGQTGCRIDVGTNGAITVSITAAMSAGIYIPLDGLSFDTESVNGYVTGTFPYLPITMDGWHTVGAPGEPGWQATWTNYSSTFSNLQFRKGPDGKVQLRGLIRAGQTWPAGGVGIFQLPVGYRPPRQELRDAISEAGQARIDIYSGDGMVAMLSGIGNAQFLSLDGIEFDTDTVLQTASVSAQPMDAWHLIGGAGEPAFQNSWANSGGGYTCGFRKYPDGRVRLKGNILGGSASVVFTLPVGYRPPINRVIPMTTTAGSTTGYCQVYPDGTVYVSGSGASYLDGVEFDTESQSSYPSAFVQINAPPKVTSLPVAPVDGQEVYFVADAANGVLWHLRYNAGSASPYKWEMVGGGDLHAVVDTGTNFVSTVYADLPGSPGPSVTVPLAGDYDVELGSYMTVATNGQPLYTSFAVGATAAIDADAVQGYMYVIAGGNNNIAVSGVVIRRKTAIPAASALVAKYRSGAGTLYVSARFMRVRPVRVG